MVIYIKSNQSDSSHVFATVEQKDCQRRKLDLASNKEETTPFSSSSKASPKRLWKAIQRGLGHCCYSQRRQEEEEDHLTACGSTEKTHSKKKKKFLLSLYKRRQKQHSTRSRSRRQESFLTLQQRRESQLHHQLLIVESIDDTDTALTQAETIMSAHPISDEDAVAAADKEMEERANRAKALLSQRYVGLKRQQVRTSNKE